STLRVRDASAKQFFHAGNGGSVIMGSGNGGAGGAISDSHLDVELTANDSYFMAGHGGNAESTGNGGVGGSIINNSSVTYSPTVAGGLVRAGSGGQSGSVIGAAGNGGSVNKLSLFGDATNAIVINAGHGGDRLNPSGAGGNGGSLTNLSVTAPTSDLYLNSLNVVPTEPLTGGSGPGALEPADAGLAPMAGGTGGSITNVTVFWGQTLSVVAGRGGDANSGTGGLGGSINGINAIGSGNALFDGIHAGPGGNGGPNGGKGGSINNVTTNKGISEFFVGSGGTGTPTAGQNGSATGISAQFIDYLYADDRTGVGFDYVDDIHAVFSLSNVTASLYIGLDANNNGLFDFSDLGGTVGVFDAAIDEALDGFAIVRPAGLGTISPSPLKIRP
ncbi:MAG: hypothetical protein ABMA13_20720, partial [Chthoniobacteraceae bacterium]